MKAQRGVFSTVEVSCGTKEVKVTVVLLAIRYFNIDVNQITDTEKYHT